MRASTTSPSNINSLMNHDWLASAPSYGAALLLAVSLCACGSSQPEIETGGAAEPDVKPEIASMTDPPVVFEYETLEGEAVSTETVRGRMTVIAFGASYDMASQAQARFVTGVYRAHSPRINALLLIMEPAENRTLIEAFVHALKLPYPVAFADQRTIAGQGPFAGLHHVPSVIILDREGREVWRRIGLSTEDELDDALDDLEDR